ncbi:uncharacterized protein LOC107274394 isoform X2 [Cephus cinctus]|uniref:Uncharacterized protein LOC107274394 isoform X2 n=1 Tax=Cephus cinctus TaxID=211228 RepID=A0AAJ7RVZ6_CEPCN|nr:uncharacterized protein LOC107274394 isoform X2 [Cephus cinctus]
MGNGSLVHALTYSPDSSTLITNSPKIAKNGSHINLSGKVTNFEYADACKNKNLNEVVRPSESTTLIAIKKSENSCIRRMQSFDKNIMVEIKSGNLKNISHKICQSHNRKLLNDIFETVANLESSLSISRNLEFEHCLKYSTLISKNVKLHLDLQNAFKRNKTMLNLFRQNVGFGTTARLPRSLKREIQRTWHEKYDALLKENSQLKKAAESMQLLTKEKDSQTRLKRGF